MQLKTSAKYSTVLKKRKLNLISNFDLYLSSFRVNKFKAALLIKKLQQFCWIGGFCSLVQLHRTNESPPSSLNCIFIVPLYKYEPFNGISPTLTEKGVKIEQQQLERRTLYLVCHLVEHDIFKERNGPIVLERALTHTVLGYIFKCTCLFVCLFVCLYVFFNFLFVVGLLDC